MQRKAYLYMRFSSAEQAKGDSLARQRALAADYITRHPEKELSLVEDLQFIDEGVSSFSGQNLMPGRALHAFLESIDDGTIPSGSVMLVESLDRLSRQHVMQAQRLLLDILLSGISVVTTSPAEEKEYDGRSGLQDLMFSLAGMERANRESAIKSERVKSAWKKKKEAAGVTKLTSRCPSWLKLNQDRKSFTVVEEKAAVVRRVFELSETIGHGSLVRVLNSEGVPPLVRGASGWHESTVSKLLSSPAVIGTYQPHEMVKIEGREKRVPDGNAVENYYPAIVDAATYYRIQILKKNRKTTSAGRKGRNFANIFSGIAKCASCNSPMVIIDKGRKPKGGSYLVCNAARRGSGCKYRAVRYRVFEWGFLSECQRVDISNILPGGGTKKRGTELRKQRDSLFGEAEQKKATIQKIVNSIETNGGEVPKAIQSQLILHENRINSISEELKKINDELDSLQTDEHRVVDMRTNFAELMNKLRNSADDEKFIIRYKLNETLKAAVEKIEVGPVESFVYETFAQLIEDMRMRCITDMPDLFTDAKDPEGRSKFPPIKGEMTLFKVSYKNGNAFELYVTSRQVVGGRATYRSDAHKANAKVSRMPNASGELSLSSGYGIVGPDFNAPRGADGKFVTRNQESEVGISNLEDDSGKNKKNRTKKRTAN